MHGLRVCGGGSRCCCCTVGRQCDGCHQTRALHAIETYAACGTMAKEQMEPVGGASEVIQHKGLGLCTSSVVGHHELWLCQRRVGHGHVKISMLEHCRRCAFGGWMNLLLLTGVLTMILFEPKEWSQELIVV